MKQSIPLRNLRALLFSAVNLEFDYVGIIVGKDLQYNNASKKYFTVWDNYKDAKGKQGLLKNPEELNKLVRQIYFVRRAPKRKLRRKRKP
jgi:DUF2075 family protein